MYAIGRERKLWFFKYKYLNKWFARNRDARIIFINNGSALHRINSYIFFLIALSISIDSIAIGNCWPLHNFHIIYENPRFYQSRCVLWILILSINAQIILVWQDSIFYNVRKHDVIHNSIYFMDGATLYSTKLYFFLCTSLLPQCI